MKPLFKLAFGAGLAAMPLISSNVMAQEGNTIPGYVTDTSGVIVRTGFGECWHTSEWTPEMAVEGCDNKLAAAVEVAPTPTQEVEAQVPVEEHLIMDETGEGTGKALFEFNKATLTRVGRVKLDGLVSRIRSFQQVSHILVTGHADKFGSDAYNMRLSRKRAETVRDVLLDQQVVEQDRIEVDAKGESEPVPSTIEKCAGIKNKKRLIVCLAPNRRVVIDVTGIKASSSQ